MTIAMEAMKSATNAIAVHLCMGAVALPHRGGGGGGDRLVGRESRLNRDGIELAEASADQPNVVTMIVLGCIS
jgi:hypothetical protein